MGADTAGDAKLIIGGKEFDMPVRKGTVGPDVLDISSLYGKGKMFTYDPGFTSTASCESKITYIDGDEGVLLYRGYPIEQLAEQSSYLEVAYLLIHGELPDEKQFADWKHEITSNAVEVYIHGLRKKLGADIIRNVRGVGYMVPKQ